MKLTLPYPPSVNHYWRTVLIGKSPRTMISREGRQYQKAVAARLFEADMMLGPLSVHVEVFPPDRRRRDLDNILKSLLDAMGNGGAYEDDSQIVLLSLRKRASCPPGRVEVTILPAVDGSGQGELFDRLGAKTLF